MLVLDYNIISISEAVRIASTSGLLRVALWTVCWQLGGKRHGAHDTAWTGQKGTRIREAFLFGANSIRTSIGLEAGQTSEGCCASGCAAAVFEQADARHCKG